MKIIIAGRTQSGKTTLMERLAAEFHLTPLKTCTTRPKRYPEEDTYHFYTLEEAENLPETDMLCKTASLDAYARWANRKDVLRSDIAILDRHGIEPVVNAWDEIEARPILLIYASASRDIRRTMAAGLAKSHGQDVQKALERFNARNAKESPEFDELEASLDTLRPFGVDQFVIWHNRMRPDDIERIVRIVWDIKRQWMC